MMKSKVRLLVTGLCFATATSGLFAQEPYCSGLGSANDMSWKWYASTAYEENLTIGPGFHPETYSYAFGKAVDEFLKTEISPGMGPNGKGKVRLTSNDYGPGFAPAWVTVHSGSMACTYFSGGSSHDLHTCGPLTNAADRGTIVMNNTIMSSVGQTMRQLAYLHEIGHIFGMGHTSQSCNSFMRPSHNGTEPLTLTSHEKYYINYHYSWR